MYKHTLSLPIAPPPENVTQISLTSSSSISDLDTSIEVTSKKPQTFPVAGNAYLTQDIAFQEKLCEVLYARPRNKSQMKFLFNIIKNFSFIQTLCHEIEGSDGIDKAAVFELIKNVKYLRVPQGKIIYKQDEVSKNEIYMVFSGEVGILVKKRDLVTRQNIKNFETFKKFGTVKNLFEQAPQKEINPLLVNFIESYMTSNEAKPKETMPRFMLTVPERDHESYNMYLRKWSTLIKCHILFMKGLKRRQKIFQAASSYGSVRDRINRGGYFGELRSFDQKKREETAIALSNCEILVVEESMFEEMKEHFYNVRTLIKEFIFESFPKLDEFQSSSVRESLAHALEERRFDLNNKIISEGNTGEYFYVLYSGQCEISKELGIEDPGAVETSITPRKSFTRHTSIRKKALLSTISKGVFLGEEILFSPERKYYYSVRVISTKAVILAINVHRFAARFPADVYEGLKEAYSKKESRYLDVLKTMLLSAPYDEFEFIDETQSTKKSIVSPTESFLRKPLKLRRKKALHPSLRLDDNLFLNAPIRQPVLSSKSLTSRKELGVFNIGSIGMFYKENEGYVDTYNQQPLSFSGIQDHTPSYNHNIIPSYNKLDFTSGLTLQIPKQSSQTDILQLFAPPTENSFRHKETPRKSAYKKEMSLNYAKETTLNIARTVSHPSEEVPDNFNVLSLGKARKNVDARQKYAQWKTFRDSANNTPLSTSSVNSQVILKKDDRDSQMDKNDILDDEWNFMKSLIVKKVKPSKFQEVKNKKDKGLKMQGSGNIQAQSTLQEMRQTLKTASNEGNHKHSGSQEFMQGSFGILKLQEKLEKTQRMHLYSRSISHRDQGLGEKLKGMTQLDEKLSFPKINNFKKTLNDFSPKAGANIFSPKSDRFRGKTYLEMFSSGVTTLAKDLNMKTLCGDEMGNEKKSPQGFVRPIVFPVKDKKARRMINKSIGSTLYCQEERVKTLNPGSPMGSQKVLISEQAYFSTCGSITKLEETAKKDEKVLKSGKINSKVNANVKTQEGIFKQKSPKVLKRGEMNKERRRVSMKKIEVYVE